MSYNQKCRVLTVINEKDNCPVVKLIKNVLSIVRDDHVRKLPSVSSL